MRGKLVIAWAVWLFAGSVWMATAFGQAGGARSGILLDVPLPLSDAATDRVVTALETIAGAVPSGERRTVVMRYRGGEETDSVTAFEDALRLARTITSPRFRRLRVVSFIRGTVGGHAVLPILASERVIVADDAVLMEVGDEPDETIDVAYQAIAKRRGLFPQSVVDALLSADIELTSLTLTDGTQTLASGDALAERRAGDQVVAEDVWKGSGQSLRLTAGQLRDASIASDVVSLGQDAQTTDQIADRLDLAKLTVMEGDSASGPARGVLLNISGSIASNKSRRWQSNLTATLSDDQVNTWLIKIDSDGGDFGESAGLATWFASPEPPLRTVAGLIDGQARGDSALIALACDPLFMTPDSRLGGAGADAISTEEIRRQREFIETVARRTNRSPGLMLGLLDRSAEVFRYTNRKTGRVVYSTETDLIEQSDEPEMQRERWQRGERIELADGLSAVDAIALGLVDGEVADIDAAARRIGLEQTPPPVTDRGLIRWVERIGQYQGLAFLILMIGFSMLSAEASAPGMGVPGFLALLCFAFFFWTQYLAGTAEWLEFLAFALGIGCIAIEIFVVPGFGVFGIGGLALTLLGVVLMSQTFVVPRNVYQVEVLTQSIWIALGALASTIVGFLLIRRYFDKLPMLSGLIMEQGDLEHIEAHERLADFSDLQGQTGVATTTLRPAGKAMFGDRIVNVISDGSVVEVGASLRVTEVLGNRVVVEPTDG